MHRKESHQGGYFLACISPMIFLTEMPSNYRSGPNLSWLAYMQKHRLVRWCSSKYWQMCRVSQCMQNASLGISLVLTHFLFRDKLEGEGPCNPVRVASDYPVTIIKRWILQPAGNSEILQRDVTKTWIKCTNCKHCVGQYHRGKHCPCNLHCCQRREWWWGIEDDGPARMMRHWGRWSRQARISLCYYAYKLLCRTQGMSKYFCLILLKFQTNTSLSTIRWGLSDHSHGRGIFTLLFMPVTRLHRPSPQVHADHIFNFE